MRILIIEDNHGDRRILQEGFKLAEPALEVSFASDPDQALSALKGPDESLPDLILLDINLPKKSGKELLRELKGDERLKHIPVVILTSAYTYEDVTECYEAGANCFLIKPMSFDELKSMTAGIVKFWLRHGAAA